VQLPTFGPEFVTCLAYLLVGPVIWVLYGLAIVYGRKRMLLVSRPPVEPVPSPAPSVTILIPAKDEGERIRACVLSALAQDYPNFNVITIDDRSTDDTGAVMDELAAADPKLRVLHVTEPPATGWTGKNNALWQGQKLATGEWLLLVDSDVILEPDALSATMAVVLRKKFDLLSLLPRLESHSFWESLLVPLAAGAASSMYLIALTNAAEAPRTAFANGQFMLMSRRAYDAFGGHERVKDRYCEDVEIARILKTSGLRPRVAWGNEFSAVRMYSSLGAIFRGWSRIYYAAQVGSPWRVLAAASFVVFCCFSAYLALAWGAFRWTHPNPTYGWNIGLTWAAGGAIHLGVMTSFLAALYRWSGNPRRNALFFPLGGGMLMGIFARALRMCVTKKVEWRGTAYSHTMASKLPGDATQSGAKAA
jgi:chlorobactene glucosyltransferase